VNDNPSDRADGKAANMDATHVDRRAADVVAADGDPEVAHAMLDDLWLDVLDAIAKGRLSGDEAQRAAQLAIAPVGNITRWYA